MSRVLAAVTWLLLLGERLPAQSSGPRRLHLEGAWQAKTDDGIRHIMVRSDSSAQFGDQVARWRLVGDSLWLTLGDGVWMVYGLRLGGDKLTISGGDLDKPVTLRRVGPATARPDTLAIPPSPPDTARAWD
ncbi:MAG: hypothetical protein DMD49_04985 [Gemmatimonadetes bacterium]|nr:MAG: hypothetical protein DMD49_04985 [Gemmatimonadota bacterium]